MLKQAVYWLLISSSIFDGLLLGRIIGLRLHKLYAFITLDCVLGVLFDSIGLYLGSESPANTRVWIYSRFLYALLTPLIAWDVFEEVKHRVLKVRRLEAIRLFLALAVIGIAGLFLLLSAPAADTESAAEGWTASLGIFFWGGSSLASALFLFRIYRSLRTQNEAMPNNTFVWTIFYLLGLGATVLYCALMFTGYKLSDTGFNILNLVLISYGILCTAWCAFKLKATPREEVAAAG